MPRFITAYLPQILLLSTIAGIALAADPKDPKKSAPYSPFVQKASKEGEDAIRRFQYDKSLKVELWAAEPMLANPVCFAFDGKGRCYVAETFRHSAGATDNRGKPWLDDDLASRTVEDRVAMFKKFAGKNFVRDYETEHDRVRLLEDTTGSGKADKATVFRDDFGQAGDGIGAGLLARNGDVYFTCIPGLFKMKDTSGSGHADVKETLSTGYGVHVAFIGHDLHGLRMGPDGKLYFSIGDRGFNVKTKEGKHLFYPDTGAVLRCDLDGANLEVVHTGLRNPQELAFDDHGNLFTVDNNSDSGDRARFVYIVEGGDSGWRIGYQYGSSMHDSTVKQGNRGPFNYEKLWHPYHEGQAAYIVPPLNNFADGPSGFTHYPGVGLSDKYKGHFFLCDFRGGSGGSGVWSFTTKQKGAAFELMNPQHFVWSILATDCDFGPDCGFYISDWSEGWNKPGKGRIYKVTNPEALRSDLAMEVKKLLAEGFDKRPIDELVKLLEHPHQQVRMEAQFAMAAKGKDAIELFSKVAKENKNPLARLHAIWGLGQIATKDSTALDFVVPLLKDGDAEVRAQSAKAIGVRRSLAKTRALVAGLHDPDPRVLFFVMQSLAQSPAESGPEMLKLHQEAIDGITEIVKTNADRDPYLRHAAACAYGTLMIGSKEFKPAFNPTPSVQLAAILGYRHFVQASADPHTVSIGPVIENFLRSADPKLVNEAARMIHDLDMRGDLAALAALSNTAGAPEPALYRALNAHFRLGERANAAALANFAARADAPANLRVLALQMLGSWAKPPRRDYVTGLTQNIKPRDASVAVDAIKSKLAGIFSGPPTVQKEAATVAGKLGITEVGPFLFSLLADAKSQSTTRIEALRALDALKDKRVADAVTSAIASDDPRLRNAGRSILIKTKPDDVLKQLKDVLAKGDVIEKQGALALLADIKSADVDDLIESWLDKLIAKQAPPELQLDILEAAGKRGGLRMQRRLKSYEESRPKTDELGAWRETLFGGDAARGKDIFLNKSAVQCQRCHKLDGEGGEVGPPLNGLAGKQKRDYLLESIVLPNKQIAKGYDSVFITKTDGKSVTGVLKSEDNKEVKLMTAEGLLLTIKKEDIEEKRATKSAMPEDIVQKLNKHEIRDLVEFLAGLKEEWKK